MTSAAVQLFDGPPPTPHEAPEFPNVITFLYQFFPDSPVVGFLHENENLFFSIFMALSVSLVLVLGARGTDRVPSGIQNILEWFVETCRDFVVSILGEKGVAFVPFLGTLFIYIFCMNIMGLVPLLKAPPTSVNVTAGLAICVFALVMYLNVRHHGLWGFIYHLMGSPKGLLGWAMVPILFPVELINQLARPLTLSLRLFGNINGEEILIVAFATLGITILNSIGSPVGLPLQVPFMFLALLTSLMQALVFTLLSAVYILLSMETDEIDSPEGELREE